MFEYKHPNCCIRVVYCTIISIIYEFLESYTARMITYESPRDIYCEIKYEKMPLCSSIYSLSPDQKDHLIEVDTNEILSIDLSFKRYY